MAFEPAIPRIPVSIPKITISLIEAPDEMGDITQSISYNLAVRYDDESEIRRIGNLVPHLTPQQITALQTFMADMRTLAETEILP